MTRRASRKKAVEVESSPTDIDELLQSMNLPPSSEGGGNEPSVGDEGAGTAPEEPTLGELYGRAPENAATNPRILISDEPLDPQTIDHNMMSSRPPPLDVRDDRSARARQDYAEDSWVPLAVPTEAMPNAQYVQRINVLEAFQYPGTLVNAPPWIDRNWIGWQDFDEVHNIPAGPALSIPGVGVARRGDFVVQQSVMITEGGISDIKLAIYRPEEFYKWFLPVQGKQ